MSRTNLKARVFIKSIHMNADNSQPLQAMQTNLKVNGVTLSGGILAINFVGKHSYTAWNEKALNPLDTLMMDIYYTKELTPKNVLEMIHDFSVVN